MYYKLSNTAGRKRIERLFKVSFKYPKLYQPQVLLHGADEVLVSIITEQEINKVLFAIWGLLPEGFRDDWQVFQDVTNTLNLEQSSSETDLWFASALHQRRCLIVVTGFFTTLLKDGETYPYHIGLENGDPFFLAGVYNQLDDGFLTCSLVVKEANGFIQQFQNAVTCMPLVVDKKKASAWLDVENSPQAFGNTIDLEGDLKLHAKPIEKEFFKQNISYDSMLVPYSYPDLPNES